MPWQVEHYNAKVARQLERWPVGIRARYVRIVQLMGDCTRTIARGEGMTRDRYNPVPFDVEATRKRWSKDPAFKDAYNALADEFAALSELVRARQSAGLTQADVAERMGIAQASVGRLESSAGSRKHSPSMATLRRYADAVGCNLHIALTPAVKTKPRKAS